MSSRSSVVAVVLALGAAAVVFQLKHTVLELERELKTTRQQIEEQRWRQQKLRADRAYLTRPERIAMQARQLGMQPLRPARIAEVGQIVRHDHLELAGKTVPFVLPSGAAVELRIKPVQTLAVDTGGPAR